MYKMFSSPMQSWGKGQKGEWGEGRSWKLLGGHKEKQVLEAPSVYGAFTTCQGPVWTPLYALVHLILTIPSKVGTLHDPTLLTSKLRLREVT